MAALTALQAVTFAQQIYVPTPDGVFDKILDNGSVRVGIKKIGTLTVLAFAGSEDKLDFVHDASALPFNHPQLGIIHYGFWQGVEDMFKQLTPYLTGDIALVGHSLGCSHAAYVAGLCGWSAIRVNQLLMFAPPRMSYQPLVTFLRSWVIDIRAWCNGVDPVPRVPVALLFAAWVQICKYLPLDVRPEGWDGLDPIEWHMIAHYMAGIRALEVAKTS